MDKKDKDVLVNIIYNSTRGRSEDIIEMYNQAMRTKDNKTQEEFYRKYLSEKLSVASSKHEVGSEEYLKIEKQSAEAFEFIFSEQNKNNPISVKDLKDKDFYKIIAELELEIQQFFEGLTADIEVTNSIKKKLKESYDDHKKIIAVSHSQGNEALRSSLVDFRRENANIENDFFKYFGVMHMASPSPAMATSSEHARNIRLDRDLVVLGSTLFLPESPGVSTYKYERSELSWFSSVPVLRMFTEFLWSFFGKSFYHSMNGIYLSDKVFASKIDGTDGTKSMKEHFTNNLIEVAQSLEANCMSPVIKISAPDVTEVHGQLIATGYAGPDRVIDLKVEDIGGDANGDGVDDVAGYDRKQTEFSYKVEVVRPTSPPVVEELIEEPLTEDSNGSLQIKFNAPYRDYNYTITVIATNYWGNKAEVSKVLFIPNNKAPTYTIDEVSCPLKQDGYSNGETYLVGHISDDQYLIDGNKSTHSTSERNGVISFSDGLIFDSKNFQNSCPVVKPVYHWKISVVCQKGDLNVCYGSCPVLDPSAHEIVNTGLQWTYVKIYDEHNVHKNTLFIGEANNELGSMYESFYDPNYTFDPTKMITVDVASACARGGKGPSDFEL